MRLRRLRAPALTWTVGLLACLGSGRAEGAEPAGQHKDSVDTDEARGLRESLVRSIQQSGLVRSERVLDAMRNVPRHRFVSRAPLDLAYADRPLPIGSGQTISQPMVVGIMTEALALEGRERVLEVGTGSGYQAAVLSRLASQVYSIELLPDLGEEARARLRALGYENVHVRIGDGYAGWPEQAPFDRILLTAAPPEVPQTLLNQLADGGVLVAPVGGGFLPQRLVRMRKVGNKIESETLDLVRFVPMIPGR